MTIPEAIAYAKADLSSVQNKMQSKVKEQQREHRKSRRAGGIKRMHIYTSPEDNNWLCVITTNKKQTFQCFLMWFYAKEGLCGLQPAFDGLPTLFTPHLFTRYREYSGHGAPEAVANLQQFFFRNPSAAIMGTGKMRLGFPAVLGSIPDGFVLGTQHDDEGYVRCRTYVNHERAFKNQAEDWEALDAVRQLRERFPALHAQVLAEERAKKKQQEEGGENAP
ncbi:MAG: hypothetical protein ABI599_10140 [Flavobacteriales bacterium]